MELLELKKRIGSYQGKVSVLIKDSFGACGTEIRLNCWQRRPSYNPFLELEILGTPERVSRYYSMLVRIVTLNLGITQLQGIQTYKSWQLNDVHDAGLIREFYLCTVVL